ncbi:hypothetical protein E4U32_006270 [Claviceps aff. humidiphila group G2b]|nr:hypothetical protein E4U32_006270 [Claviceps aff. humidiphila group G2b]
MASPEIVGVLPDREYHSVGNLCHFGGLRVFEFHDSWEESACRPKVRGGWTGSPLRRAGIVAAASVTHVPHRLTSGLFD